MTTKEKLKEFPVFASDAEAAAFVDTADLSEYDFSQFKPMRFEFSAKTATISMRVPDQLLQAVKAQANREGLPYQRYIRQTLERALSVSQAQNPK